MEKSAGLCFSMAPLFLVLGILLPRAMAGHDYGEALSKSFLFFEAQRSGYLPSTQRVRWRGHSGLNDGKLSGVDLVGGYYDAGDNVRFGLPMAFAITMMSWSVIEYGGQMGASGELGHAIDAIKWGTDYLIKAHPQPYVLYGENGIGHLDTSKSKMVKSVKINDGRKVLADINNVKSRFSKSEQGKNSTTEMVLGIWRLVKARWLSL